MRLHAKWARKLLGSKSFVLLTDKESVIYFSGLNPDRIEDNILLHSQTAALLSFSERLNELILKHEKAIDRVLKKEGNAARRIKIKR